MWGLFLDFLLLHRSVCLHLSFAYCGSVRSSAIRRWGSPHFALLSQSRLHSGCLAFPRRSSAPCQGSWPLASPGWGQNLSPEGGAGHTPCSLAAPLTEERTRSCGGSGAVGSSQNPQNVCFKISGFVMKSYLTFVFSLVIIPASCENVGHALIAL